MDAFLDQLGTLDQPLLVTTGYTGRDAYLAENTDWKDDAYSRRVRAWLLTQKAMDWAVAGATSTISLKQSQEVILEAAEGLTRAKLPTSALRSEAYITMDHKWDSLSVMEFFHNAGICALEDKDYEGALVWLVESSVVLDNMQNALQTNSAKYDWLPMVFMDSTENSSAIFLFLWTSRCYMTRYNVLQRLGNTAAGMAYLVRAYYLLADAPLAFRQNPTLSEVRASIMLGMRNAQSHLHPEPSLVTKLRIVDGAMHLYGSWKKIHLNSSRGVTPRMDSAVFVDNGYLYVCGGQKTTFGPTYLDFWRLDLEDRRKWEPLPMFPSTGFSPLSPTQSQFFIRGRRAYLFDGSLILHHFDLDTQTWDVMLTTLKLDNVLRSWPYPYGLKAFSVQCVDERIYIFGGQGLQGLHKLGSDLLLELDLSTRQWRRLSGTYPNMKPTTSTPGPRVSASSWLNRAQTKMFIMNGHADRVSLANTPLGSPGDYNYIYDDLWSWNIVQGAWTKEKIHGNSPGPRSEMAAVYNSTLDAVIVFGGYNSTVPCRVADDGTVILISFFADTFICDMNETRLLGDTPAAKAVPTVSMKWKQVLTRGFPTYRANAHLIEDPATGKTYLFSGFFQQEFLPEGTPGDVTVKSFADIWELRLDVAGGYFEGVDIEEESRTAKAGPWQRCFACGSVGSWKKCAGACGGRAFFCDVACLKDGWKEHKSRHQCRKI